LADPATTLERFFDREASVAAGDAIVVAFSGGGDSTALLLALVRLAADRRLRLVAAHLDHGLDPGSAGRAQLARRIAGRLEVAWHGERRPVAALRRAGESEEAAARRVRYGFLEEVRRRTAARWIATAHHRDDQAETVALRLLAGTGLRGLAAIRARSGAVVRPLLDCSRAELAATVAAAGLAAVTDPTNRDLARPRNRLRHRLLPALEAAEAGTGARLAALAAAAGGAGEALGRRLADRLLPCPIRGGLEVDLEALSTLPGELLEPSLALLHRLAGAPYPAGGAARRELVRQLGRLLAGRTGGGAVEVDCGGGWRWSGRQGRFALHRPATPPAAFSYTLRLPGTVEITELGLCLRLFRSPSQPWMRRGEPRRAAMALPLDPGDPVTVRSRRPGDRLRPLGAPGRRRLKELLIDRGVPRRERDRLPLVCLGADGERIAWVPGVTVDESFRLAPGQAAWVAEIEDR
jgi:tRNA(Ile)-lysidine synthase